MMQDHGPEVQKGRASPPLGPFGYSFLAPMDTPYEQAPALPPGPSLLDDNESNMLDNFFTTMNANHFTNDFWLRGQQNKSSNFEWSDELPPTFEGSTTSLSQPSFQHGIGKPTDNNAPADIFAAASMLYQSGMNAPELESALAGQTFPAPLPINGAQLSPKDGRRFSADHLGPSANMSPTRERVPGGFHTSQMLFDVHNPLPADQHPSKKARALRWGSDSNFMDQGYIAPPDVPDDEARTEELLENLQCFEPQRSADNTRPPSPERIAGARISAFKGNGMEDGAQPRKRQRTLVKEEDDAFSDEDDLRPQSRKSKPLMGIKGRRTSADMSRRSRMTPGSKAPRENLTEEQKRTNHILSEQKRRNLIRQGFDDLCSLVPSLHGGGFSKSAMLTQAADWLEDVLRGNEILRAQLADLKGINGLVMPR
ncbi:hypothetical protein N7474_011154 [Penicillium riverlandense]|uniref:uncharacterized protein n=1 Tax=Penicillium riverlandense TaxID=1903569 RepID=UPI0025480306|nr:uncharacterized protein N7474_011154 [Penicillium riverlandense]KAJ5805267.1 hypothetical protein N7474_011154 [Penicillium riverlandense]